jgi:threonyl-tRNA synthetase
MKRVPYLLVAGDREVEACTLAVRTRSGKDLGSLELKELTALLCDEVASRGRLVLEDRLSQRRSA